MKKIFSLLAICCFFISCNNSQDNRIEYITDTIITSYMASDEDRSVYIFVDYGDSVQPEGSDGIFGTSDDNAKSYSIRGSKVYVSYDEPGNDQSWFTRDDQINGYDNCIASVPPIQNGEISSICYYSPGDDGI